MSTKQASPRVTLTMAREVARFGLDATDTVWHAYRTNGAPVNLVKDLYPEWQHIRAEGKFLQTEHFITSIIRVPDWSLTRLDVLIRTAVGNLTQAQQVSFYERDKNSLNRVYLADMLNVPGNDARLTSVTQFANLIHSLVVYAGPDANGELAAMLSTWLTICDVVHGVPHEALVIA